MQGAANPASPADGLTGSISSPETGPSSAGRQETLQDVPLRRRTRKPAKQRSAVGELLFKSACKGRGGQNWVCAIVVRVYPEQ